ncbi:MAG TPA: Maf family protein [Gammaproteobacteria bacterium]|nr:Maf family protein [Gammaproteobacteria bacterium]
MTAPELYLASTSPRRHDLLRQIGVAHKTLSVSVDETPRPAEAPADYVMRLAQAKAAAGVAAAAGGVVLAADTTIAVDGAVLGKPDDRAEARAMLARLAGRGHDVFTSVALTDGGCTHTAISHSRVFFRSADAAEIDAYVATGEGDDKAGAYAIQGRGAVFVERLEGSYSGVVGLPLCETAMLLRKFM